MLKGFIIGLALTIVAGQLPKLFGVEGTDGDFFEKLRELLGLGAANLAAGLSRGMVVNGSLSKTAVNGSAGARS